MRLLIFILLLSSLMQARAQDMKPEIIGQSDLSTDQGKPITILLTDLQVRETEDSTDSDNEEDGGGDSGDDDSDDEDDDSGEGDGGKGKKGDKGKKNGGNASQAYPEGYVLKISEGDNYSISGNTLTPHPTFTGILTAEVRVKNSKYTSPKFPLKITVTPVNQPPVITGQSVLTTPMDTQITIDFSDLQVTDPDDPYPTGFSIILSPGKNYEVNQTTIHPTKGFTGNLSVPAVVNDGTDNSKVFKLKISVTSIPEENVPPQITGQSPVSTSVNQPVDITLSQLVVTDPDNEYPEDFTLKVFAGENYSLQGQRITPAQDFIGELTVKVTVRDGKNVSEPFMMKVTVNPEENKKPVITGQVSLKITEDQSLKIELSHLIVEDSDNEFSKDFTLKVLAAENYSVSGTTVTPVAGFLGMLNVKVTVHDGTVSSDPFALKVEVTARARLEIVGQQTIELKEDSAVTITTDHLTVNDPSRKYPVGFVVTVRPGQHYEISKNVVRPQKNFSGVLAVEVTVSSNGVTSAPYALSILVTPVNDAPELLNVDAGPVSVTGPGPWPLFDQAVVSDADDSDLLFAEIAFSDNSYVRGSDKLQHDNTTGLKAVFDDDRGILLVAGRGTLAEYQTLIQSVTYTYATRDSFRLQTKKVLIRLSDGKDNSIQYERPVVFESEVPLEIPTAFTPNNDNANDTWKITSIRNIEQPATVIRVYDRRGNVVFESSGLQNEWDGFFNGRPLPADVYFYTIEMDLSYRRINYKGIVSILR